MRDVLYGHYVYLCNMLHVFCNNASVAIKDQQDFFHPYENLTYFILLTVILCLLVSCYVRN